jgi:hypothetical protein
MKAIKSENNMHEFETVNFILLFICFTVFLKRTSIKTNVKEMFMMNPLTRKSKITRILLYLQYKHFITYKI